MRLALLFLLALSALERSHPLLHKPHSLARPRAALSVTQHTRGLQLSMQTPSAGHKGANKVADILMGRATKATLRTTQDELVKLFEIGNPKVSSFLT